MSFGNIIRGGCLFAKRGHDKKSREVVFIAPAHAINGFALCCKSEILQNKI